MTQLKIFLEEIRMLLYTKIIDTNLIKITQCFSGAVYIYNHHLAKTNGLLSNCESSAAKHGELMHTF